jgi:hypothetical protein
MGGMDNLFFFLLYAMVSEMRSSANYVFKGLAKKLLERNRLLAAHQGHGLFGLTEAVCRKGIELQVWARRPEARRQKQ